VHRRPPLRDFDNAVASLKEVVDALITGGLLVSDAPEHLKPDVVQVLGPERGVGLEIRRLNGARLPWRTPKPETASAEAAQVGGGGVPPRGGMVAHPTIVPTGGLSSSTWVFCTLRVMVTLAPGARSHSYSHHRPSGVGTLGCPGTGPHDAWPGRKLGGGSMTRLNAPMVWRPVLVARSV
jgi:hypothetical protein